MRWCAAILAAGALGAAPAGAQARTVANRCVLLRAVAARAYVTEGADGYVVTRSRHRALPFRIKPTGLGTYLLFDDDGRMAAVGSGAAVQAVDAPGPAAEWARRGARWRSTAGSRALAVDRAARTLVTTAPPGARFALVRVRRCRAFPEAQLDARGTPFRGRVEGFADVHLHVTANQRAGGAVIYGEPFDRFGIAEALGHDADVHGSDGSLDVTGNLLRSGTPTGTHDPHGWPTFAGWPTFDTYTHQQTYYRWLQRAWMGGLRLVVAQTVEDEPLCQIEPVHAHSCDETATVEAEIATLRELQDYVDAQAGGRGRGWFRLVYGPAQARRAIRAGKLAVIVGVESSDPFGCSERLGVPNCDRAQIDRVLERLRADGVRGMFLAHWVDNALAGAALEGGAKGQFISAMQVDETGEPFSTGPCPFPAVQGEEPTVALPGGGKQCNTRGLTDLGAYAVQRMMDDHMLVEVDHLSERARDQVLLLAHARHYPLVSSHTGTGGAWAPEELRQLYADGGFATVTLDDAAKLPAEVLALRAQQGATPVGVGIGSDTGGFNALPGPQGGAGKLAYPFRAYRGHVVFDRQRTGTRTFDLNTDGVAHYGLLPDLLARVQQEPQGPEALAALFDGAASYLATWSRTGAR